eukprot:1184349-Rhodomonas_salina.3
MMRASRACALPASGQAWPPFKLRTMPDATVDGPELLLGAQRGVAARGPALPPPLPLPRALSHLRHSIAEHCEVRAGVACASDLTLHRAPPAPSHPIPGTGCRAARRRGARACG